MLKPRFGEILDKLCGHKQYYVATYADMLERLQLCHLISNKVFNYNFCISIV